ncbi:MAG: protein BatD, partial [Proteobacteria bacterium]
EGETVRLVVEFPGSMDPRGFDPAPLQADFEVLGTSSASQINIVDGKEASQSQLVIDLAPRRQGVLTIPSLSFSRGVTVPISLRVLAPGIGEARGEVFLEVDATPGAPYVQSPVDLSVRLFLATPLLEGNLSEPELDGALVRRVGDDSQYDSTRDGVRYRVIERRFVVIPQRSGRFEIPPLVFDGRAASGGSRGFGGLFQQGRRIRARSQPLELDVMPPPPEAAGEPWLPARGVTLTETWPEDPPEFIAGTPITRTLRVEAVGVTGEQIPELSIAAVEGLRSYPDKADIDTTVESGSLKGTREQRIALVPSRAGTLVLPAIEITWWDTTHSRLRVARVSERAIEVLPASGNGAEWSRSLSAVDEFEGNGPESPFAVDSRADDPWRWLTLVFAVLWVATALSWYVSRLRRPRIAPRSNEPEKPRLSIAAVESSCRTGRPADVRAALLAWAASLWPDDPPAGLDELASRLGGSDTAVAMRALDRACYGGAAPEFDGRAFWRAVSPGLRQVRNRRHAGKEILPRLYPEAATGSPTARNLVNTVGREVRNRAKTR